MTPNEAGSHRNHDIVKRNMGATRERSRPQEKLQEGDKVRVRVKKKLEKGYSPDCSGKLYTVSSMIPGNTAKFLSLIHI